MVRLLGSCRSPETRNSVGRHDTPTLAPAHNSFLDLVSTQVGRRSISSRLVRIACVRCSLLRPDPAQRARLEEIRDNLLARIAKAQREGWLGEVDRLKVSLASANDKLAQLDRRNSSRSRATVELGTPTVTPPDQSWRAAHPTNPR